MAVEQALVLGEDLRSFLTVVRSLGRQHIAVDAAPLQWSMPALRSRYIRQRVALPPYSRSDSAWVDAMRQVLARARYDLVIPCDDRTIIPLMRHREAFSDQHLALPNDEAFEVFYDKLRTREAAIAAAVPVSPGRQLTAEDSAESLIVEHGLPLVLKPRRSYRLTDPAMRRNVVICREAGDLRREIAAILDREDYFVERFFPGDGAGVSVLAKAGRVLQAFEHHRVHEPITGGGSSYRVSAELNPAMLACVTSLAAATRLSGVAMFEFRQNHNGGFILVEVNARFWGSLPLAVASGVDFPYLLYRQMVANGETKSRPYRVGVYSRNVTADFYCTIGNFALDRKGGTFTALGRLLWSALQWTGVLIGRERHDSWAWDDPQPAAAEYAALIGAIAKGVWKRLPLSGLLRHWQTQAALRRIGRLGPQATLLVLCQGNICRSPFGALILKKVLGPEQPSVVSAGLLPYDGRPSPAIAQAAARGYGIDLSTHRSRYADDDLLERASAILVFDEINEIGLARRSRPPRAPVIRFGDVLAPREGGGEILDPEGKDAATFERAYERIARAAERLSQVLYGSASQSDGGVAAPVSPTQAAPLTSPLLSPDDDRRGQPHPDA